MVRVGLCGSSPRKAAGGIRVRVSIGYASKPLENVVQYQNGVRMYQLP